MEGSVRRDCWYRCRKNRLGLKFAASIRDLTFRDTTPMGPSQDLPKRASLQAPVCRSGWRRCLLKECGCGFEPSCARRRYCSEACCQAARGWQVWIAQWAYRHSEKGRAARREQCRRRRARQQEKQPPAASGPAAETAREGHQKTARRRLGKKIPCRRPGCYEGFVRSARSPWKRFCSALCREALRMVRLREQRWRDVCLACPLNSSEACLHGLRGP